MVSSSRAITPLGSSLAAELPSHNSLVVAALPNPNNNNNNINKPGQTRSLNRPLEREDLRALNQPHSRDQPHPRVGVKPTWAFAPVVAKELAVTGPCPLSNQP